MRRPQFSVSMGRAGRGKAIMLVTIALASVFAGAADESAFPPAEAGLVRNVIHLPQQEDESRLRVEIIVGKRVKTDAENRYSFAGRLEKEVIPGWGLHRYVLRDLGPMAGTLVAVDPSAAQAERFISLGGEERLIRYNSRLPLVVDVHVPP